MPEAWALAITCCATVFRFSNGSVVVTTNCTGRPDDPGSGGNWNAAMRAPAILFHLSCRSTWIWCALRVRSPQFFSSTPPMPALIVGTPVIWNICLYSGAPRATLNTCCAYVCIWSDVAVGEPTTCDSTMPWSSSGASSDFDMTNMMPSSTNRITPITISTG